MAHIVFHVDQQALASTYYKLGEISKSAMPVAARQTINQAAIDMKKDVQDNSKNPFVHRNKTFYKSITHIDYAKGFDVNSMVAAVGFMPNPTRTYRHDSAVEDMEKQENGGNIAGRAFIPTTKARYSKSKKREVAGDFRLEKIGDKILNMKKNPRGTNRNNDKMKFILSALHSLGGKYSSSSMPNSGGFVIGRKGTGGEMLWHINSVYREKGDDKKSKIIVRSTPIYSVKKGRKVRPGSKGGAHFGYIAQEGNKKHAEMAANFNKFAKVQFDKVI
jgi:hypothetical protein